MRPVRVAMVCLGMTWAGCAVDTSEPKTNEVESAVIGKWSEPWNASANDINDIWPATTPNGTPISNMYMLIKKAPAEGENAQFFAFVVWNGNNVGHIYRVPVGPAGANIRNVANGAIATRTSGAPSKTGGFAGNPEVEPGPIPRPHID